MELEVNGLATDAGFTAGYTMWFEVKIFFFKFWILIYTRQT